MIYSGYNKTTGEFCRFYGEHETPPEDEVNIGHIEGHYDPNTYYMLDGLATKYTPEELQQRQKVDRQGNFIWKMPERILIDNRSLATVRDKCWAQIKLKRAEAEKAGFTWNGHKFDSDAQAQMKLFGAAQLATLDSTYSTVWTLYDNSELEMNAEDIKGAAAALGMYIKGVYEKGQALRLAIYAAATIPAAEAISW